MEVVVATECVKHAFQGSVLVYKTPKNIKNVYFTFLIF